jgi:hemoglobin
MSVFTRTLFEMVGGEAKLDAFMDHFMARIKANPDLAALYPNDMSHLKAAYKDFAMEFLGGPKMFSRKPIANSLTQFHSDIPITKHRADAMLQCAVETMENFHIPRSVQQAMLDRLEGQVYSMINA